MRIGRGRGRREERDEIRYVDLGNQDGNWKWIMTNIREDIQVMSCLQLEIIMLRYVYGNKRTLP